MTIHLPKDVENSINAEVLLGHFASVDNALTEAWRNFQRQKPSVQQPTGQGSIGAMRDAATELDEATEHAHRKWEGEEHPAQDGRKPIWEAFEEISASVPDEEWAKLPVDGAEQHDHYIYGSPKRPTA